MADLESSSRWRLSTGNNIPYKLISLEGEFSDEDASVTQEIIIRSRDVLSMLRYAFPEPVLWQGTLLQAQPPVLPGLGTLIPHRVSFKSHDPSRPVDPFSADPGADDGTYCDYVNMTVRYGPNPANEDPPDPNDPFTFLEVSANASGVFLNSPLSGKAKWVVPDDSDETTEVQETNIPHTVTETNVEWTVTWPQIPFSFWNGTLMARLRDKLGTVNSSQMALLFNAPVDTILFLGYSTSTSFTWRQNRVGQAPVHLQMKFLEKNFTWHDVDVTHQHVWRPNYGWRRLKIDDKDLFTQTNLNDIWAVS